MERFAEGTRRQRNNSSLRCGFSVFVLLSSVLSSACSVVYWVGVRFYYDKVDLPADHVFLNIPYDPSAPDDHKRQLDLFLPAGAGFPSVIFIHGGGWAWGDRSQRFGGADVYGNIGRFLASEGFGAAVPSYRLIWKVDWRAQVADAARAVAWVQKHIGDRRGNERAVFLMGHSAGAELALRLAAEPQWLEAEGGRPREICGVIAVSGAGYDMEDPETRRLDTDKNYFSQRFADTATDYQNGNGGDGWRHEASIVQSIDAADPPTLLMLAEHDYPSLKRQTEVMNERLTAAGIGAGLVVVPGVNHERIVLKLSRPDQIAGPAILKFLRETRCPR